MLKRSGVQIEGKSAVVVGWSCWLGGAHMLLQACCCAGRSRIVGIPVALLLLQSNATVQMCHSKVCVCRGVVYAQCRQASHVRWRRRRTCLAS